MINTPDRPRVGPLAAPGTRALGVALGFAADRVLADPERHHPVAGFGRLALAAESALHPGAGEPAARRRGVLFTTVLVGGAVVVAAATDRLAARAPAVQVVTTAVTVWTCLGGTSLLRVAECHADFLEQDDVVRSRQLLPWLCGRDASALTADELARAVVEPVAENTSDAAVATLFWAAVAGPAAAVAHRASNTLDAMVGHRSERYAEFGWASARLDDVLGWPAARVTGLITMVMAGVVSGRPSAVLRTWRRDASSHPSPNAGVVESACAGALGVRLGGPTPYPYGAQSRPTMGSGTSPTPADVRRAVRLMRSVQFGAAGVAVVGLAARGQRRSRSACFHARRCSAS